MSTVTPVATSVSTVPTACVSRVRAAIISAVLTLGALAVAVVVLWQPWGARNALGYADIAPHRDAAWIGAIVDGLGFAAIGIALGLAVCVLAPTRGSTWANIGAVLAGLGGVTFCAGMVSFGSFAWYATSADAIPVTSGTSLMSYVQDNPGHILGLEMAGFVMTTLGSLVLMVALWRSRSVPRWLPIGYLVLTVGVFALGGVVLNVVQAVQTLSLVVVAFATLRAASRPADPTR
jgi:hypothetical protein